MCATRSQSKRSPPPPALVFPALHYVHTRVARTRDHAPETTQICGQPFGVTGPPAQGLRMLRAERPHQRLLVPANRGRLLHELVSQVSRRRPYTCAKVSRLLAATSP